MIWRMWIGLTVVVVVGAWVWMVPLSPPPTTKTTSAIDDYRDKGLLPKACALVVSEEVGHDVFEVPPGDAEERARIIAALGRAPVEKKADAEDKAHEIRLDDNAAEEEDHEIRLDDDEEEAGEAVASTGEAPGRRGHGAGGADVGITILAEGSAAEVAPFLDRLDVDRTVKIEMAGWGYSPGPVLVEAGGGFRLRVSTRGALPPECMLMDGVGMQAVNYRLGRADWNLLEHKAIYEVPLVMPGHSFELVAKFLKPGMWMYMCMFPYHMEHGMMGMFMTAGVSMDGMGGMGGPAPPSSAGGEVEGVGVVVSVAPADGRVVLDHEAIEGYMGAMEMSYMVTPASLLDGIQAGDKVRFTIDTKKRMIVGVTVE